MQVRTNNPGAPGATFVLEDVPDYLSIHRARQLYDMLGQSLNTHREGLLQWRRESGLCGAEDNTGYCMWVAGHPGQHDFRGKLH